MDKDLKILHIVDGMDPKLGGVCQAVRMMVSGLETLGVTSEVVCAENPSASYLAGDGHLVHALGKGKGPWSYCSQLLPWLKEHFSRFDAVILHGLWLYQNYAVRKIQQCFGNSSKRVVLDKADKPKIYVMPHGMLDPYFQKAADRRIKALRNWVYWKIVESKVVNNADGILFTSLEEYQLAQKSFSPYRPKDEFVVGLGVAEPPPYTPSMAYAFAKSCPDLNNLPFILYLSRIDEKKGLDLLIKAYAELVGKAHEFIPAELQTGEVEATALSSYEYPRLVIAGPGLNTSYGHKIQETILSNSALKDTVFFPGMLTGDTKWGAFYGCEAFVLTSHQENFGIAIVEALSCSKPVLISDKVNIWREIVAAGGGIAADDTFAGAKHLLTKWVNTSEEAKLAMGRCARGCYEEHFAVDPAARRLLIAVSKKTSDVGEHQDQTLLNRLKHV